MSYNISSENFSNPLLKDLLEELTNYFTSIGSEFYVIGATARDLIFSGIHNQESGRKTDDLDIAIAISDWNKFEEISNGLCQIEGFLKSEYQKQRFIYKKVYLLDIVPFGEVAKADNNIFWPPEETHAMSVAGFTEVAKHTLKIAIDENFTINVASLPGIFLLKLIAWRDRHLTTNKDADDMAFIISNYLEINEQRVVNENYDLYLIDDYSIFKAGATLLGRDMKEILIANPAILSEFIGILRNEVVKEDDSQLINQMMKTHSLLKYEAIYTSLISLTNELSN